MCSVDGVLFSKDKTQLYCYPAGKKQKRYDVPEGVTWTGGDAFAYNPYLETVTVPNSVTQMCFGAFSNCANLKSVMLSESLTYIEAFSFEKCTSLKFLEIPEIVSEAMINVDFIENPTIQQVLETEQMTYDYIESRW